MQYSDRELDELTALIISNSGEIGYRMAHAHLHSLGIKIQQHRIRESMRRVEPIGVSRRWSKEVEQK